MTFSNNTPFSRYTLDNDPSIIMPQVVSTAWDETRDEAPLASLLYNLSAKRKYGAIKAKRVGFAIGDYFQPYGSLGAAMTEASTEITMSENRYFEGDIVYIYDTTAGKYLYGRLKQNLGTARFEFEVLATDGSSTTFATATSTVNLLNSSVPNDGKARPFLNKKGDLGANFMQRGRDTVGVGKAEESESFLAEHGIESLVRKAFRYYAKKKNLSLYYNMIAKGNANETYDNQIAGGFPYFLNPHGVTSFSESSGIRNLACKDLTFKGQNKVISGANWNYRDIRSFLATITKFGGKDKIVPISMNNFLRLVELLESQVTVVDKDLKTLVPSQPSPWEMPVADFGVGRLWFLLDRSIDGSHMLVKDDVDSTIVSDSDKWMLAFDPNHVNTVPMIMDGKVMDTHIAPIDAVDNDSVQRVEFDSFDTMIIDEPRSCGYLGLKTT